MHDVPSDARERANVNPHLGRQLIAGAVLALAVTAWASDDWQYWNQLTLKHEFNDRLALDIASEQKWRDDMSDFFLYSVFIVPTVRLTENVSLGAGYRLERKEEGDSWTTENRLLFPLTIGWTTKPWLFQLRNQLEYRNLEDDRDRWRIRERILLKRPIQLGELTVIPFVSEEPFYDFTVGRINQNRAAAGLSLPWQEHVTFTLYYMNKAERAHDWAIANVLGTELALKF
jgi:hypothetical protein